MTELSTELMIQECRQMAAQILTPSSTGKHLFNSIADRLEALATPTPNSIEQQESVRIYTRCPACHNDTLVVNKGHLLCTWHECPDPTSIDEIWRHTPKDSKMVRTTPSLVEQELKELRQKQYDADRQRQYDYSSDPEMAFDGELGWMHKDSLSMVKELRWDNKQAKAK